jgi:hypothetical protein
VYGVEDSAFLLELLAGVFFIAASVPLLRLSGRTREAPERVLGVTFLLYGASYLFYELPFALTNEALLLSFSFTGRLLYDISVLATALFIKLVFHRGKAWADQLLWFTAALLVTGIAVSGLYGDWEGMAPLSNPGFWPEWTGQMIPFVWVTAAGFTQYAKARRRVRLELTDPLVCNRFLLFGTFGLAQTCSLTLLVVSYIGYEKTGSFTHSMDLYIGMLEYASILAIWFAFFPPAIYRSWVNGPPATAEAEGA